MAHRRRRRSVPLARQRAALAVLHRRLVEVYGQPAPKRRRPPLDELVLTILSQNTSDTNRDRAWRRLRERFPTWRQVAAAPLEQLEEALAPGGLQRVKARRIRDVLARVHAEEGDYALVSLQRAELEQARARLSSIKGLGEKSVNCVLLFSLGLPAFPVDTHVYRVLGRLGVHRARTLERANRELQEAVAAEACYALHVNLIRHGREVCHARKPACERCGIVDLCSWVRARR